MLFKRAETMIMLIAFEKTPEIGTPESRKSGKRGRKVSVAVVEA